MPVSHTFGSITGKDWEGDGVQPDVALAPAEALEWALEDLGIGLAEAARLSLAHAPSGTAWRDAFAA